MKLNEKIQQRKELESRINQILECDEIQKNDTIKLKIMEQEKQEKEEMYKSKKELEIKQKSNEDSEFEDLRKQVEEEMENEELHIEKDAIGRNVLSEADEGENNGDDGNNEENGGEKNKENGDEENTDKPEENKSAEDELKADEEKAHEKNDEVKDEKEEKELKPGETTTIQNFDEFFQRTDTKLTVKSEGKEPSPIFGPNDTKEHNKYKITITNNKGGSISWIYWDSIENTEKNEVPDDTEIMKDFGTKLELAVVGKSFDEFKKDCGYEDAENSKAQEQYNNLRKMKDEIKKIYPDQHQVYELIQVSKKV